MLNIFKHVLRYFIIDNNYKLLIRFQRADVYLNGPIAINELIKLTNQLASQKHTRDRSSQDNNNSFESKQQVGRSKDRNKRRSKKCQALIKKRHIKGRKYVAPINFAEYLNKLEISENSKVYYEQFLQNRLHERHCYISNRLQ